MTKIDKNKEISPLVKSVLALDTHFSDLIRLGEKIESMDLKSDFDFEQMQKLLNHFAEHGQGIADEVVLMSTALNEARARAETTAKLVADRAVQLQTRKSEQQIKMEEFRLLGEKVRQLTTSLVDLKQPEGSVPSEEDRLKISKRLSELQMQLHPLIDEAQQLKKEAQTSKMKVIEQGADSLGQSLAAISQKLISLEQVRPLH